MADDAFVFNRATAREIVESVRKLQRQVREITEGPAGRIATPQTGRVHVCRTGDDAIPAMTSSGGTVTPGEGEATLLRFKPNQTLQETSFTRTIYNIGNKAIEPNSFGLVWQELLSGRFVTLALPGIVRFELTEILTLGGEADALFVEWNGAAYATTAATLVVKDFTDTPGTWWGAVGYHGWAWLPPDSDDGKYEIVWMETVARYIEFTSTENMGATTTSRMAATVNRYWNIKNPGSTVTVHDPQGLFTRALSGAKGVAIYDERRDLYEIVECQTKAGWVRATLTADVSGGSTTGATVNDYGGSQQDVQSPGSTVTLYDYDNHFKRAKSGADALAIYDAIADQYLLVECESKAGWIRGTLNNPVSSSSSSGATVSDYGGSQQDIQNPGSTVTVYDPSDLFSRALSGAKFYAIYDADEDKYNLVECQTKAGAVEFTLTADMSGGSSSAATVNRYYGAQQDVQSPGGTVTIYDDQGLFPQAKNGAKGVAIYDAASDKYRAVECQQLALMMLGTLDGALLTTDASITVDGLSVLSQEPYSQSPGSSVTADNTFNWEGDDGATVLVARDGTGWKIIQLEC